MMGVVVVVLVVGVVMVLVVLVVVVVVVVVRGDGVYDDGVEVDEVDEGGVEMKDEEE